MKIDKEKFRMLIEEEERRLLVEQGKCSLDEKNKIQNLLIETTKIAEFASSLNFFLIHDTTNELTYRLLVNAVLAATDGDFTLSKQLLESCIDTLNKMEKRYSEDISSV